MARVAAEGILGTDKPSQSTKGGLSFRRRNPDYVVQRFKQLDSEISIAVAQLSQDAERIAVQKSILDCIELLRREYHDNQFTVSDLQRLEFLLLEILPDVQLKYWVRSILAEHEAATGTKEKKDAASELSDDPAILRQQLLALKRESNVALLARDECWRVRSTISSWNLAVFAVSVFALFVIGYKAGTGSKVFMLAPLACFFAGTIGGVISTQRRTMTAEAATEKWVGAFCQTRPPLTVVFSSLYGGVGAIVVFALLRAELFNNLLSSHFLPKFREPSDLSGGKLVCFLCSEPSGSVDAAILFCVSILAGFSERLVPDLLDRLRGQKEAKNSA